MLIGSRSRLRCKACGGFYDCYVIDGNGKQVPWAFGDTGYAGKNECYAKANEMNSSGANGPYKCCSTR